LRDDLFFVLSDGKVVLDDLGSHILTAQDGESNVDI